MTPDDRLIHMANQIAKFFESQPESLQLDGIADHINRFWERRMKEKLLSLSKTDEAYQFHPLIIKTIDNLK